MKSIWTLNKTGPSPSTDVFELDIQVTFRNLHTRLVSWHYQPGVVTLNEQEEIVITILYMKTYKCTSASVASWLHR